MCLSTIFPLLVYQMYIMPIFLREICDSLAEDSLSSGFDKKPSTLLGQISNFSPLGGVAKAS